MSKPPPPPESSFACCNGGGQYGGCCSGLVHKHWWLLGGYNPWSDARNAAEDATAMKATGVIAALFLTIAFAALLELKPGDFHEDVGHWIYSYAYVFAHTLCFMTAAYALMLVLFRADLVSTAPLHLTHETIESFVQGYMGEPFISVRTSYWSMVVGAVIGVYLTYGRNHCIMSASVAFVLLVASEVVNRKNLTRNVALRYSMSMRETRRRARAQSNPSAPGNATNSDSDSQSAHQMWPESPTFRAAMNERTSAKNKRRRARRPMK